MVLPYSIIHSSTGEVIAQFARHVDATSYVTGMRFGYDVIDTHRIADYRRKLNLLKHDRAVVIL